MGFYLEEREVTTDEGAIFAKKHNLRFFETSAKTGTNVEQVKRFKKKIE